MSVPQKLLDAEKQLDEAIAAAQTENPADEATPGAETVPEKDESQEIPAYEPQNTAQNGVEEPASVEEQLKKALHKVSVLEGKLKSLDTRELQSRLSRVEHEREQFRQTADTLFSELRELKLKGAQPPAAKSDPVDLTDEQKELYGEMIPVMTAVVNKALAEKGVEPVRASQIEDIGHQVQQVRAEVGQERQRAAAQAFFARVDALVPDREALERSPEFVAFMEERDWKTGKRNQDLLIDRGRSFDAEGAAAFYREFKKSIGNDDAPAYPNRDPREKYLSPGKAKASAPVSRKGLLTPTEAAEMVKKVKRLIGQGKHDEADKINNELIKRMSAP